MFPEEMDDGGDFLSAKYPAVAVLCCGAGLDGVGVAAVEISHGF